MMELKDLLDREKLENAIEVFVNSRDIKDSSKESYFKFLYQFKQWFLKTKPADISPEMFLKYKKHLKFTKKKPLTINNYLVAARKFIEWAGFTEAVKEVKGVKLDKGFRHDPLTIDQIQDLLTVFDLKTVIGKRDYAIINLMLRTGLRTHEIIGVDVQDIRQMAGQSILYILGKGKSEKTDYVILTQESQKPILDY